MLGGTIDNLGWWDHYGETEGKPWLARGQCSLRNEFRSIVMERSTLSCINNLLALVTFILACLVKVSITESGSNLVIRLPDGSTRMNEYIGIFGEGSSGIMPMEAESLSN